MKYIISSGTSVVSEITDGKHFTVILSDCASSPKEYPTFGDAMKECFRVNGLIGHPSFKVMELND